MFGALGTFTFYNLAVQLCMHLYSLPNLDGGTFVGKVFFWHGKSDFIFRLELG